MHRQGKRTIIFDSAPSITGNASVVGSVEGEGPMCAEFDRVFDDDTLGEESYEKSESALQKEALTRALKKAGKTEESLDFIFAGDLLNQCSASTFGMRDTECSFLGMFGACSTMALTLASAAVFTESGAGIMSAAVTSSHFCTAERQFRMPLEYGGQRPQSAQRTVTGAGASIVSLHRSDCPSIEKAVFGRIVDMGIADANNMGAAMAPAAAGTIADFFEDTGCDLRDFDYIVTGDLGFIGSELLRELLLKDYSLDIGSRHLDCGKMIFHRERQDVHAGGSGCGCSASVLNSYFLNRLKKGEMEKILFVATGALMSPTTSLQGETIPSIAHLVELRRPDSVRTGGNNNA